MNWALKAASDSISSLVMGAWPPVAWVNEGWCAWCWLWLFMICCASAMNWRFTPPGLGGGHVMIALLGLGESDGIQGVYRTGVLLGCCVCAVRKELGVWVGLR